MSTFEEAYISCRDKEGRIYSDEIVKRLPEISTGHQHYHEWQIRAHSAKKLSEYVLKNEPKSILEIGCGNGWLSNYLASTQVRVVGMDVNQFELTQARRIFPNIQFILGDITKQNTIKDFQFDMIVIASVIQYFPSVTELINVVKELLNNSGEIHILDSPIYANGKEASRARLRSIKYFEGLDAKMTSHYFHHSVDDFGEYNIEWLWRPGIFRNRLNKLLNIPMSPFPWVCIKNT